MELCNSVELNMNPCLGCRSTLILWVKFVKAPNFVPDVKVVRFMPIVIDWRTLLVYQQRTKSIITIEANLRTYLSFLTISLKSLMFTLAYFYEIKMSFYKSASKTQSHIQSTAKYIFLTSTQFWKGNFPWDILVGFLHIVSCSLWQIPSTAMRREGRGGRRPAGLSFMRRISS